MNINISMASNDKFKLHRNIVCGNIDKVKLILETNSSNSDLTYLGNTPYEIAILCANDQNNYRLFSPSWPPAPRENYEKICNLLKTHNMQSTIDITEMLERNHTFIMNKDIENDPFKVFVSKMNTTPDFIKLSMEGDENMTNLLDSLYPGYKKLLTDYRHKNKNNNTSVLNNIIYYLNPLNWIR